MRKMREHCDMCHQCNDDSRVKQKVRNKWESGIVEYLGSNDYARQ